MILTFDLVIKDRQKRLDIAAIFNHNEVEEISHDYGNVGCGVFKRGVQN